MKFLLLSANGEIHYKVDFVIHFLILMEQSLSNINNSYLPADVPPISIHGRRIEHRSCGLSLDVVYETAESKTYAFQACIFTANSYLKMFRVFANRSAIKYRRFSVLKNRTKVTGTKGFEQLQAIADAPYP